MVDRFLVWLGAGVVTAGMSAAMISGTAIAFADTGSSSDTGGASSSESSESSKSADSKADSEKDESTKPADSKPTDSKPTTDADKPTVDKDATPGETTEPSSKPGSASHGKTGSSHEDANPAAASVSEHKVPETQQPADKLTKPAAVTPEPEVKPVADTKPKPDTTLEPEAPKPTDEPPALAVAATKTTAAVSAAMTLASAPSAVDINSVAVAPQQPSLINVIGTLIFTLFNTATRLFEGPPLLPPGSTVTVRTSTLHIDYGPGYDLPANWYFPDDPNPNGLIYLQHGFLASAPFYSYTAATLAEQTHSIVVAPSVTSNFFAYDGFWLGGAPYQQGVADLFVGDRKALTDSASAAIGHDVTLPQRVVIAGHSAGGGLALGAASYMVDNGTIGDLAGLILLDGVALGDVTSTVFDKIPDDLPVYQIASPPYAWNMFGATSDTLVQARPGRFNGVQLVGGSHIDAMQGGNPLMQFAAYLVAGFSQQQNIEAVKTLATGWINDMFAGTHTGSYADPGDSIDIPTAAGTATAIALPASEASLSPLDQLLRWWFVTGSQLLFNVASPESGAAVASKAAA